MAHKLQKAAGASPPPRPRDDDGTYRCYHDDCTAEADLATPRRISGGYGLVGTAVTYCLKHYLAWEVLDKTGSPLRTLVKTHEKVHDDLSKDPDEAEYRGEKKAIESYDYDDAGWVDLRLYARALARLSLFDDPVNSEKFASDLEHSGPAGDRLKRKIDKPVINQIRNYGLLDPEDDPEEPDAATFEDFS